MILYNRAMTVATERKVRTVQFIPQPGERIFSMQSGMRWEKNRLFTDGKLKSLTRELGNECQKVLILLNQLQLPDLTASQQATILAELLSSTIHLNVHCGEDFQDLIADAMEALPDDDEM
jgi:hypothetical protein